MENILEAVLLEDGDDDDIEFVILDYLLRDPNEVLDPHFNLETMSDEEIVKNFRFERHHLPRLKNALGVPDFIITHGGDHVEGLKALCILLKRFAYPCRLVTLKNYFGMSSQSLSQIIRSTCDVILAAKGELLTNLANLHWLNRERMEGYADAVHRKGGAIPNCWGFIDGTIRPMCRPSVNQEQYYSGHKRVHCLKYQIVLCPDGIIASLIGAFPGRRHDVGIFRDSNLYAQLEEKCVFGEDNFVLYGDQGYALSELLITPFPGQPGVIPQHHVLFNQSMKVLRVAVEWGFAKVLQQFAFVDFKKNQKLLLQDLETYYKVAVLMSNAHTCLYGSQTANYFNVVPPDLEEYFG